MFAHATGFCSGVWRPVRAGLSDLDSTAVDFRGHGASRSHHVRRSWWDMALDVVAVVGGLPQRDRTIGVGHSMGGAALVMAELRSPGTFDALVLVEPIIFGGPYRRDPEHPLVRLALRRRDTFESRAAVVDGYSSKPPFDSWHPDALAGYVERGFVETDDGVTLACRREQEAEVFTAAGIHAAWERLGEITVPVSILAGGDTDTYAPGFAEQLAGRFRMADSRWVESTGHFLPMERPDIVIEAIRRHL